MEQIEWLKTITSGAARGAIADRSGISRATLNRQIERGELSPEVAVAVARAYGQLVLEALVVIGLITEQEANLTEPRGTVQALHAATDSELLLELLRRTNKDSRLANR